MVKSWDTWPPVSLARSILTAVSRASTGVAGFLARLTTRVGGFGPSPLHRRQTSSTSPMLVLSEKKMRAGSWEVTMVSIWNRWAR